MSRRRRNFLSPTMLLGLVLLALILVPGLLGQFVADPDQLRLMAGGINSPPIGSTPSVPSAKGATC